MRLVSCALVAIGCLWIGAARAQDYNPSAGASTAPANGSLIAPASPNGVDWLNSMLGLSPSFLSADGKVDAAYVSVDLSGYVTQTSLTTTLKSYLTATDAAATYVPLTYGNSGPLLEGEYHFANAYFADPANGISADAKFGDKGIATTVLTVKGVSTLNGTTILNAQSQVRNGLIFAAEKYAQLPSAPPNNVIYKCDDCSTAAGATGVFVFYTGSAWTTLSGEAITHP